MSEITYTKLVDEKDGWVTIIKTVDGIQYSIPADEANSDYQAYLRWLENPDDEEGGTL